MRVRLPKPASVKIALFGGFVLVAIYDDNFGSVNV